MQSLTPNKPIKVNTDTNEKLLKQDEATYLKNYLIAFGANENNSGESGGNFGVGKPLRSNRAFPTLMAPAGINLTAGGFEVKETNEYYYFNWNSNNLHGIYRINGSSFTWEVVLIDPELAFSPDPQFAISRHRANLTVIYTSNDDETKIVKEKILKFVDGNNWQRWINTMACIGSDGFNETKYPYWKLRPPHFDRREYIEWAVRPPMYPPVVASLPILDSDRGKTNSMLKKSVQFAYKYILTDGRDTILSPHSNPYTLVENPCNVNSLGVPRGAELTLNVGSAMVEKIQVLVKICTGDWYVYDTLNRFDISREVMPRYWERTNQWSNYSFDEASNTIKYKYYGDRELSPIISQEDARMIEPDIPIKSVALSSVGNGMLLGHNLYKYNNLPKAELDKFKIDVVSSESTETVKTSKITVYAYLGYNGRESAFLYTNGEDKAIRFGGVSYNPITNRILFDVGESDRFKLSTEKNGGLVCYLAGTSYFSIGKQFRVDISGTKTDVGILDIKNAVQMQMAADTLAAGGYFVQQFEFTVPQGRYIARLARHSADTDSSYQKTSTYVIGIRDRKKIQPHVFNSWDDVNTFSKELEVNVCSSDFDSWNNDLTMFSVFVPREYSSGGLIKNERWRFIEGYVTESADSPIGVEKLDYQANNGSENLVRGKFTDSNGFFFQYTQKGEAYKAEVNFTGRLNCSVKRYLFNTGINKFKTSDRGYYPDRNIFLKDVNAGNVGDCNRILVRGKIGDCDTNVGISGVAVTITNGQTTYSGSDGTFELVVHNSLDGDSKERIYINSGGGNGCLITPCNNTCPDPLEFNEGLSICSNCNIRIYPTEFNLKYKFKGSTVKSQKGGGRYGIGARVSDFAGRGVFIQNIGYADIPTFMEKGNFNPSLMQITLTAPLNLPSEFKWLSFFRTREILSKRRLQWVADKIEFLDVNGQTIASGAGAIRAKITIQSLLDYNVDNNFSTIATYQFSQGDIIRFYDDGDGKLLDPLITDGFMDYQILGTDFDQTVADPSSDVSKPDGKTLIIPFDKRLLDLSKKCSLWIEIITPQDNTDIERYCEIPGTYPIINGNVHNAQTIFPLDTWDTYYINRKIKVDECKGKVITHIFESPSPSDFWGKDCPTCGRTHIKDPQAEQRWYEKEVIKSDELVNEGRVNGLGVFREKNKHSFKGDWGGIVAIIDEHDSLLFICNDDWFLTDYNMNYARVTAQGIIAVNLDQNLGEPHKKVGDNYGCEYVDTSTIDSFNGVVIWVDRKNSGIIAMNYSSASDIASIDNKSYFENKLNYIKRFNEALPADRYLKDLINIVGGIDPQSGNYHVTFRPRRNMSVLPQDYINNEREVMYEMQETFVFNMVGKFWNCWVGFTPEYYGRLSDCLSGTELITFAAGQPYLHNSSEKGDYNTFYGIATDQIIEYVMNESPDEEKQYQGISVQSNGAGYFADRVVTDKKNSYSYIPVKHWRRIANIYFASINCNMGVYPDPNHPVISMLRDGGLMNGLWIKVRLVRDQDKINQYNELHGIRIRSIRVGKSAK